MRHRRHAVARSGQPAPETRGTEDGLQTRRNCRSRSCSVNRSEVGRPCGQWWEWSARPRWRTRAAISSGVRRSPARSAAPGCRRPGGQPSRRLALSWDRPEGRFVVARALAGGYVVRVWCRSLAGCPASRAALRRPSALLVVVHAGGCFRLADRSPGLISVDGTAERGVVPGRQR